MPKVNKVAHVVLAVKDVTASVKFYTEALGMEAVDLRESHKLASSPSVRSTTTSTCPRPLKALNEAGSASTTSPCR